MKYLLLALCFALCGCATAYWHMKNEEFVEEHRCPLPLAKSQYTAEYLGKENNEYLYKIIDDAGKLVLFRLSLTSHSVKVEFNSSPEGFKSLDLAVLYTDAQCNKASTGCNKEPESEYPKSIYLNIPKDFGKKGKHSSSYPRYWAAYSSRDGDFYGYISNDNLDLSAFDNFVLGIRNTGYIAQLSQQVIKA